MLVAVDEGSCKISDCDPAGARKSVFATQLDDGGVLSLGTQVSCQVRSAVSVKTCPGRFAQSAPVGEYCEYRSETIDPPNGIVQLVFPDPVPLTGVLLQNAPPERCSVRLERMFPWLTSPPNACTLSTIDEIVSESCAVSTLLVMMYRHRYGSPMVVGDWQPFAKPMPCTWNPPTAPPEAAITPNSTATVAANLTKCRIFSPALPFA